MDGAGGGYFGDGAFDWTCEFRFIYKDSYGVPGLSRADFEGPEGVQAA